MRNPTLEALLNAERGALSASPGRTGVGERLEYMTLHTCTLAVQIDLAQLGPIGRRLDPFTEMTHLPEAATFTKSGRYTQLCVQHDRSPFL